MNDGNSSSDGARRGWRLPIKLNFGGKKEGSGDGIVIPKRVWIGLAVTAVVMLVVAIIVSILMQAGPKGTDETGPRPVEPQILTPTQSQELFNQFGPWRDAIIVGGVETPASTTSLLWLKPSGTILESSETASIGVKSGWTVVRPPFITNMSVSEATVTLTINQRDTYTLALNQPFIFSDQPTQIYRIGAGSEVQSTPSQTES